MGTLDGRVALVTGGGGGIGAATARRLAAEGAAVVVNDLGVALDGTPDDRSAASRVADEIVRSGGRATADTADVTDFDAVGALVERTIADHGKVDVVAHAAGILRDRMLFNMSPEEWSAVRAVHLDGLFNLGRHVVSYWRGTGASDGKYRLITFTSRSGLWGGVTHPNYAAAKMGVIGFTYACARGLGRYGITATAICPVADTRMTVIQGANADHPAGTVEASPDNVARVVAYVAGYDSDWLNGEVIGANGYDVSIYNRPEIVATVSRSEPWPLVELAEAMQAELRPHAKGPAALGPV